MGDALGGSVAAADGNAIAIIGLACRFPMAPSPAAFWRLLRTGADAVTDAPPHRRADNCLYDLASRPDGSAMPYRAGFLDRIDAFDADFFGVSPREADAMDPQQRLMLELIWEVFEDARTAPDSFRGSQTGVFVGAIADDYATLVHQRGLESITRHTMTGLQRSFIANRVSYTLGLRGPSLTVDTGQSSSLVAVHLACASLQRQECTIAVAGGVHLHIAAHSTMQAIRLGVLSPDGICAAFDERAGGFVRGEGAGAVVLKPLARALADGDRVYCVIRGSAVNNDGDTPGSLAAPGEFAQLDVLRAAYQQAGVQPSTVEYVELHGTGTKVGDPAEAAALGAVCGVGRPPEVPLLVGSVKTNIGHLEGAAGIAGLIKTALSIAHREIPPSLHFQAPNPRIPLGELRIRVQQDLRPWPASAMPALAGVSSFGMGGTNCHVVLAGLPAADCVDPPRPAALAPLPWVISGRTGGALRAQATQLLEYADGEADLDLSDSGFSLATTRTAFEHRAAVVAADRPALLAGLRAVAEGKRAANVLRGTVSAGRLAFLFPGQGFQRVGMGRHLHSAFPAFAEAFDAACAELDRYLERPLREIVWAGAGTTTAGLLDQTRYTQPALFAIEIALYRLMESLGLRPDLVAGHSVGEFAAAHAAGVLSLADAAKLVAMRGQLMQALPPGGAMIAVQASADEVAPLLTGNEQQIAIAAVNGPASIVISGDQNVVERVAADIARKGRKTKRLKVSHAFHSPLMEPVLAELQDVAESLTFHPSHGMEFISTVTGQLATSAELCRPGYWVEHARRPVRFASAVAVLRARGARLCLETGPGNGLTTMGKAAMAGKGMAFPASMHGQDEVEAVSTAVAGLHVRGAQVRWRPLFGSQAKRVDLPTYPFQRRRYWLRSGQHADHGPAGTVSQSADTPQPGDVMPVPPVGDLHALVTETVRAVLGHDEPGRIDFTRPFKDLGFDSGMTVELAARLSEAVGQDLQPSLVYSCPTPIALIEHLGPALDKERQAQTSAEEPPASETSAGPTAQLGLVTVDRNEAIAIIAMNCRYPGGVRSPEDLWALVEEGKDAISEFPVNRGWNLDGLYDPEPGRAGRTYTRLGGFLHDADEFDAAFFGISPREATAMDPQQRILLETCWEALERAGLAPDSLRGEQVGVFVGATSQDYGPRLHEACDGFEGHLLTGSTPSVISGRIAYAFGLRGPAVTIDTACSSSLVALHLAGQALREGDCRLALACGVTVMASPGMFVAFSMQRGLAPDGRCKPFAAAADGTAWAEGAGVVVLERLADAQRLGHPVLALIRGSATNQDGASNGLTAPNGKSQERVIRQALANAGLGVCDIDAVEAHGTGTALGDPIEAAALIATYGQGRPQGQPLLVGSLKSNIGHTQAAAGIGGGIKMVAAMRSGTLPRTLHVDEPSPHVDWSAGQVSLLTEPRPWPQLGRDRPRRAAVSSFGISGTNAHVILEQVPDVLEQAPGEVAQALPAASDALSDGIIPWVLSAESANALRAQAESLHAFISAHPEQRGSDIGYSLGTTRSHLRYRAAVLATSQHEFRTSLAALAAGESAPGIVQGAAATGTTAFVFPGQGSQWPGMALDLLESSAVFRNRMAECADALAPFTDWSLLAVLRGEPGAPTLGRVDVVQPVLFSIMVSLAAAWQYAGVEPRAVVGHSQGEIAAACVAGALSLDDAAKVVALRSRALGKLAGTGTMASIPLPVGEVRQRLARGNGGLIEIAAINGAHSSTVAGTPGAVRDFVADCLAQEISAREIDVDYASHSPHVEALRDTLIETLVGVTPRTSDIPFFSTITGEPMDTARLGAEYWYQNLRSTVQFEAATRALLREGHQTLIEVGPHPILSVPITQTAEDAERTAAVVGTLRRDRSDRDQFITSVAQAYVAGAQVRWEAIFPRGRRVPLPTYPFQHQRFWLHTPADSKPDNRPVAMAGLEAAAHPLLGAMTEMPDSAGLLFTGRLSLATHPWLAGHRVSGTAVMSATTLLDLTVHVGEQAGCRQVEELTMQAPFVLPERGFVQLRVMLEHPDNSGSRSLAIYSRPEQPTGQPWVRHASGALGTGDTEGMSRAAVPESAWPPPGAVPVDLSATYPGLAARGYGYAPSFQGLQAAWRRGGEVFVEVALPAQEPEAEAESFTLHPVLLDSALHALLHLRTFGGGGIPLPFAWTAVTVHAAGAQRLRVRLSPDGADSVSMIATEANGELVASVGGLTFRPVTRDALAGPGSSLLRLEWAGAGDFDGSPRPRCAVIGPSDPGSALPGPRFADLDSLGRALDGGAETPDLVFAACQAPLNHGDGVPDAIHQTARRTLGLVQSWLADERFGPSRLVVVTHCAVAPSEDVKAVTQAPAWGLVRSAQSENPGRFVLADVAPDDIASLRVLPVAAGSGEPQLVLRDGNVLVPRLRNRAVRDGLLPPAGAPAWSLGTGGAGTLEDLALLPCPQVMAPLSAGQVRISVRAAGLNFRDVTVALGLLPTEQPIGIEGAGVVTEVGPAVSGVAPGDRVMGLFDGAFGPVAVADHQALVRIPDGWSFTEAASVPVVFITAYQCLAEIAGVRAGETVVVHAATGGVGLAALHLAQYLGAEVFATASPGKWDVLRAMGLDDDHIASSRSLEFAGQFRVATNGRGADVVVNALAGEFTNASLGLLAPGGRFVEMGMTDIRDHAQVAADHRGVSYHLYNLREVIAADAGRTLARVLELFDRGALRHPPITTYDVRRARDAFAVMSRARHVGKIVLTVPRPLDPRGTVFITGGTGTLGGLLARHFVTAHGIRHLILASRRGAGADGAAELAVELGALGAQVDLVACDVADRGSLQRVIAQVPGDHPLTAIVHAAGTLDDAIMPSLTPERLASVLRPKSDGAWYLHELTQHLDIAAFVLFSSVVGVLGEPGQANYAAANTVLDALAQHRRARGLPATSLDWGVWEQRSGMTGHMAETDLARLRRSGIAPLSTRDALRLFDAALGAEEPVLVPVCLDGAGLAAQDEVPLLLRGLATPTTAGRARPGRKARHMSGRGGDAHTGQRSDSRSLAERLARMTAAERDDILLKLVCSEAATVLGQAEGTLAPDRTFRELGVDSLTGLELRNRLSNSTGLRLRASVTTDNPTPSAFARFLGGELSAQEDGHEHLREP